MNWLFHVVIGIALAWAGAQNAHAGRGVDLARGQALWDAAVKGRSTTIGTGNGMLKIGSPMGTTTAGAAGAARVSGGGTVPVADKQVPVGFTGEVAKEAIVGGVVGCATGGIVGCAIGVGLPLATAYLSLSGARVNPDTGQLERRDLDVCITGPCYEYRDAYSPAPYVWSASKASACVRGAAYNTSINVTYRFEFVGVLANGRCSVKAYNKSSGALFDTLEQSVVAGGQIAPASPTWYPATSQEVKDALYKNDPPPAIVDELSKYGNIVWPLGNVQVSGPAEVTGPKTTSVSQSGNRTDTTVSQDRTPLTYSGDTVTAGNTTRTSTTTTTTTNPDGSTSTSTSTTTQTTEQGTEPPKPEEEPPTDTALPPVPDLYTRKYPQGMEGIYDQYKDQLKNTSLVQLSKQLMPNVGDGGTCPSWPISFNWDWWVQYGVYDVAPPCWIWGVAKAILILSALLLARALIFGG